MVEFAGQVVTALGQLATVSSRLVAAEVERRGGVLRRGLSRRTTMLVVARRSLARLADGRLQAKLAQADELGIACLGESAFLRALDLLPPAPETVGMLRLEELPRRTGLDQGVVRLLVLFDVIEPQDGQCSFRDLVAAREVARLLGEQLSLAQILASSAQAARRAPADYPLTRLKLARDEGGALARRIGDLFAELDGQLRLPMPNPGNPSVDELFEAADQAEQEGDLATAETLYVRCVQLDRRDPIAPFNLANVLREQGRIFEAKLNLERALAIDPAFADAWYNLACLLEAEGHMDAAEACFARAIAADPEYADPLYNLAQLRFAAGDHATASELWRRYLRLDPDSEWSQKARHGLTLCARGAGAPRA